MSTTYRQYFNVYANSPIALAPASAWTMPTPVISVALSNTPSPGSPSSLHPRYFNRAEEVATNEVLCNYQGVSVPDLIPFPISGTIRAAIPGECNTNANGTLRVIARLVSSDGSVVRATLADLTNGTIYDRPSDPEQVRVVSGPINPTVAQPGDRIVFEIGQTTSNASTLYYSYHIRVAPDGGYGTVSDVPFADAIYNQEHPWVELIIDDYLGSPENFMITDLTSSEINLSWDPPAIGVTPNSFEIRVAGGEIFDIGFRTRYTVEDLERKTLYAIEIRSVYDDLRSEWVSISGTTAFNPPLVWSNKNSRYTNGLDRGVLYPIDGPGVVWNGLISVEDAHVGGEIESLYVDGVKYRDLPSGRNYQGTLTAFSYPDEFAPCNGEVPIQPGLILTRQPRQRFGLCYRTIIGDEIGHKLHLIYNAIATPSNRGYKTLNGSPSPNNPSWTIDAVPVESDAPRPTAHYILDSTEIDPEPWAVIESLLYGTEFRSPYLPTIKQITAIITQWEPKLIVPDYVSGVSDLVDGMGDLIEIDIDGIYLILPTGRLSESPTDGLYYLLE